MNIPDAAIEAAAQAIREAWPADFSARLLARAAIEAAMPAIREAIAQEIEATKPSDSLVMCECGHDIGGDHNSNGCYAVVTYQPMVRCSCKKDDSQHIGDVAADNAARIVRGGTQ